MIRAAAAIGIIFCSYLITFCLQAEDQQVAAKIVADTSGIEDSQILRLGILFDIIPDWHIYWKNPGSLGLPTAIEFELPDGFVSGKLNWPIPEKFWQGGGKYIGYGYSNQVLLFSEVTVPAASSLTKVINAKAIWLSCGPTLCIKEKKDFQLKLPLSKAEQNSNKKLFDYWHARLPIENPAEEKCRLESLKKSTASSAVIDFQVSLVCQDAFEPIEWMPEFYPDLKISGIRLAAADSAGHFRLQFSLAKKTENAIIPPSFNSLLICSASGRAQYLTLRAG